jgi:hypothetical protein
MTCKSARVDVSMTALGSLPNLRLLYLFKERRERERENRIEFLTRAASI